MKPVNCESLLRRAVNGFTVSNVEVGEAICRCRVGAREQRNHFIAPGQQRLKRVTLLLVQSSLLFAVNLGA